MILSLEKERPADATVRPTEMDGICGGGELRVRISQRGPAMLKGRQHWNWERVCYLHKILRCVYPPAHRQNDEKFLLPKNFEAPKIATFPFPRGYGCRCGKIGAGEDHTVWKKGESLKERAPVFLPIIYSDLAFFL